MDPKQIVHSDPEIVSGTPVIVGTRVPAQALLDYLEGGETIEEFLDDFPSVSREQAIAFLEGRGERCSRASREPSQAGRGLQVCSRSLRGRNYELVLHTSKNVDGFRPPPLTALGRGRPSARGRDDRTPSDVRTSQRRGVRASRPRPSGRPASVVGPGLIAPMV